MLRRLWKPVVGTTILVGAPTYLYYRHIHKSPARQTFDWPIRVRGADGKAMTMNQRIPLLTNEEVETRLGHLDLSTLRAN